MYVFVTGNGYHIKFISDVINTLTGVEMSVLMDANTAMDVAKGDFCESTIGCRSQKEVKVLINDNLQNHCL